MNTVTVGLLGFGEVGSLLHGALCARGHHVRVWDSAFSDPLSPASRRRAARAEVDVAASADVLADHCDVVISVVTAGNAADALQSVAGGLTTGTCYLDLNSVSPGTKTRLAEVVEESGACFVEGAIMAPIQPLGMATPIILAGPHASAFLPFGQTLGFTSLTVCSTALGTAAATKMCRSVVVKGLEALVTESLLAARHYGVETAVLSSLGNLLPHDDWQGFAHYLLSRSIEHGARRAEEMQEVAKSVAEAGIHPDMSEACVRRQRWAAAFPAALAEGCLEACLDAVLAQRPAECPETSP
jgi:3-hydroxyisobutyrate dehydrogenase-like beta-hydroxyacid dehydrogenase